MIFISSLTEQSAVLTKGLGASLQTRPTFHQETGQPIRRRRPHSLLCIYRLLKASGRHSQLLVALSFAECEGILNATQESPQDPLVIEINACYINRVKHPCEKVTDLVTCVCIVSTVILHLHMYACMSLMFFFFVCFVYCLNL